MHFVAQIHLIILDCKEKRDTLWVNLWTSDTDKMLMIYQAYLLYKCIGY